MGSTTTVERGPDAVEHRRCEEHWPIADRPPSSPSSKLEAPPNTLAALAAEGPMTQAAVLPPSSTSHDPTTTGDTRSTVGTPTPPDLDADTVEAFDRLAGETACASSEVHVDLSAFRHNLELLKKRLDGRSAFSVVMKSDAYGFAVEDLANAAIESGPRYICVVDNAEAAKVREVANALGSNVGILRIAPACENEVVQAAAKGWNVEEIVGTVAAAREMSRWACALRSRLGQDFCIAVHVNVDTGMGWVGVRTAEQVQQILDLPGLRVKGVMTHFARADLTDAPSDAFTRSQIRKFDAVIDNVRWPEPPLVHMAGTSAIIRFPETWRDMVRAGGILYKPQPVETDPQMTSEHVFSAFKTSVGLVQRDVPPGTSVGYESF